MSVRAFGTMALVTTLLLAASSLRAGPPQSRKPSQLAIPVDVAALDAQYAALNRMPDVDVEYDEFGLVRKIKGSTGIRVSDRARLKKGESAESIMTELSAALLATGEEVTEIRDNYTSVGSRTITLQHKIRGIPLIGKTVLGMKDESGEIDFVDAAFIPDRGLQATPRLAAGDARAKARVWLEESEYARRNSVAFHGEPSLAYHAGGSKPQKPALVWQMSVSFIGQDGISRSEVVWIDAANGDFRGFGEGASAALTLHSAQGTQHPTSGFPTGLISVSAGSSPAAQTASDNFWKAHTAWFNTFVEFVDPAGVVIDWGTLGAAQYNLLNGKHWFAFSGGNATLRRVSDSLDTVAHEFGHAVEGR